MGTRAVWRRRRSCDGGGPRAHSQPRSSAIRTASPRVVAGVVPQHPDGPAAARAVALEDLRRGGLAGPVGAEQAEDLALLDAEAHVGYGGLLAVAVVQVLDVDHAHASRFVPDGAPR
jgi:hypothetical protein